jgi:hypothetical protein
VGWRRKIKPGTYVRPAGISKAAGYALRSDTHVKSAYQLQPLKTLLLGPNSLPDCDLRRETLPMRTTVAAKLSLPIWQDLRASAYRNAAARFKNQVK